MVTSIGYQSTMVTKGLANPWANGSGKDISNPFFSWQLANKLYGNQLTISVNVKSWLAHKKMACGKGCGKTIIW